MTNYIKEYLRPIIGDDVSDDIVEYISSMKHVEDYEEFMENIVNVENPQHVNVYEALKGELFATPKKVKDAKQYKDTKVPFQTLNNIEQAPTSEKKSGKSTRYSGSSSRYSDSSVGDSGGSSGKSKRKYINFYTQDYKPGLIKGRHPCNCEASKHDLINNCTKCGRIVCEQEGSGPCFFCDHMVCTRHEMELLNANTKESDKLYNHLIEQKKSKEWKKAIETRNRLIKTDQMGDLIKNTVFDDQNDYFNLDSKWQTEEEMSSTKRKYAANSNRVHKLRKDMKLALDFASRTATVESDDHNKYKKDLMIGVNKLLDSTEKRFPKNLFDGDKGNLIADVIKLIDEEKIDDVGTSKRSSYSKTPIASKSDENGRKFRIANNDFLETVDQGLCLSMHQPWASLLVAGIKIHEGRTWKTEHRGRLWIAAAAKQPEDDEILACEEMYRQIYNDSSLKCPKKYPTGCLLGCVFIRGCLEQRQYRLQYPDGESSSPYVLICSNPVILPIFYPMQGQHKIFSLPKELHRTAKTALLSSKWV